MNLRPDTSSRSRVNAVVVPSWRFYYRIVPLVAGVPVLDQAALALEALAPFPLAQLYWGCCVAPAGDQALVYATYRRRITADEVRAWEAADLVVPEILSLLGATPAGPAVQVLLRGNSLSGAAWAGQTAWPVAVMARNHVESPTEEMKQGFLAELKQRAGLTECPVSYVEGEAVIRREDRQLVMGLAAQDKAWASRFPESAQEALDVRDREFVARRRTERRRGEFIWRVVLAGGVAAALAVLVEAGAVAFKMLDGAQREQAVRQQPVVMKLEAANGLVRRVDELAHRQLRFFEMLETINESRPRSIQFTRAGAAARNRLEIEARTDKAEDVPAYEAALRQIPALAKIEVRGLRAREGQAIFNLQVVFKGETAVTVGGAP